MCWKELVGGAAVRRAALAPLWGFPGGAGAARGRHAHGSALTEPGGNGGTAGGNSS